MDILNPFPLKGKVALVTDEDAVKKFIATG